MGRESGGDASLTLTLTSHVADDIIAEFRAFDLGGVVHLAGKIVGDAFAADRAVQAFEDGVRRFGPAHVPQHHFAAQDHGTGVDHVLVGVLGRGAMGGFKDGMAGDVIDIPAGGDANAADLRRQSVAQVIAVQVERRDDVEIRRAREHLLEGDVGDGVLDDDARAGLALGNLAPRAAVNLHRAEEFLGGLVRPVAETAFGELHDVALVDNGDALALVFDGVGDGAVGQAHRAAVADSLDAHADFHVRGKIGGADGLPEIRGRGLGAEADFFEILGEFLRDEIEDFLRLGRTAGVFDARVDVLRVFAEDGHVHLLRMLYGRGHAGEPLHRAQADVEIEHLAEGHVEGTDAAADRRRERSFDAHQIFLEGFDGVIGQPVVELLEAFLARKDFKPGDLALAAIGFRDGRIEHAHAGGPDVGTGAVAADEGENGVFRNGKFAVRDGDFTAGGRRDVFIGHVFSLLN